MADGEGGGGKARGGSPGLWAIALIAGGLSLVFAVYAWWLADPLPIPTSLGGLMDWADLVVLGVQALLLSDIYYDETLPEVSKPYLQIARLLGALFSFLVAIRLLLIALADRFQMMSLARRRGHTVLFGAGTAVQEFASLPAMGRITHIAPGFAPLYGRIAQLPRVGDLQQQIASTNARRASRLIVDEGEDGDTWQTADALSRSIKNTDVLAHIHNPWILERLERVSPEARIHPFSYAAGAARQVMMAHPPFLMAKAMGAPKQHILIIGFGDVGQAILREFLVTSIVLDPAELLVTVVDQDVEKLAREFELRHPAVGDALDIEFVEADIGCAGEEVFTRLESRQAEAEFCGVYIAQEDANQPLRLAIALKDVAARRSLFRCPIFICADHGAGLARIRHGAGLLQPKSELADKQWLELETQADRENLLCALRVVAFGSWRDALDGAGLMSPELDVQAKQFHETYQQQTNPEGTPSDHPGNQPWATLSDEYRVANRRAAAHVRAKAYAAGFDLNAWLEAPQDGRLSHELPPAADCFEEASPDFVARMSELEHRRWRFDRLLNGWTPGPQRDNYRKVHNMLREYESLGESEKAKDATIVKVTRRILEQSGRE